MERTLWANTIEGKVLVSSPARREKEGTHAQHGVDEGLKVHPSAGIVVSSEQRSSGAARHLLPQGEKGNMNGRSGTR